MKRTTLELLPVIVTGLLLLAWVIGLWREYIPYVDWALYCYSGLVVLLYFAILWSISRHMDPMTKGTETTAVVLFLVTSLLLVVAFGFGWQVFGNFVGPNHASPTKTDAFYFSVVAFTTLGFGDFAPHTDAGKIFLAIEALMGTTHMAAFFAIVVSRVLPGASKG